MAKPTKSRTQASKTSTPSISSRCLIFVLPIAIPVAFWSDQIQRLLPARIQAYLPSRNLDTAAAFHKVEPQSCDTHKFSTEIVSLDPLVIYINNFTSFKEAEDLIAAGEPDFEDSFISRTTGNTKVTGRTSQSAPLEPDLPLVSCILNRARKFMGTMLLPHEPFSVPQLVRYFPAQRYDLHTDFWPHHQIMNDGSGRRFNRIASFFVFLRDNCTEGETYFPLVDVLDQDSERGGYLGQIGEDKWSRGMKDGEVRGVKFKPITGNAVFWVNIDGEGNGDRRLVHAGLPVGEGEKIGMNIWPRKFYGYG